MKWKIRQEEAGDEAAIADITRAAFAGKPYAVGYEDQLAARLRDAGALVLSLVAVHANSVIGHIALSPAKVGQGRWLTIGPVAVMPDHQRKGIGSDLINTTLSVARTFGRDGVVLAGDPDYYQRFGFVAASGLRHLGARQPYLQALSFTETPSDDVSGDIVFHAAFNE